MTPKEHAQACGHVNRIHSKFREQYEESTVDDVNKFVNNHACDENLGDHDAHVVDRIVKANKTACFLHQRSWHVNQWERST